MTPPAAVAAAPDAAAGPAPRVTDTPPAPAAAPVPRGPWLLGVRHHGPGSARAVRDALDAARPRAVLIEGPPEADALLPLAADPQMRPPVALLAHVTDDPGRASFWPFAAFSPEWIAVRWALDHGAPVRFIDLPAAHSLAVREQSAAPGETEPGGGPGPAAGPEPGPEPAGGIDALAVDPLAVLAEAAGYDDPERWWEDVVEHRGARGAGPFAPFAPFEALAEAMGALREEYGHGGHARDLVREAYMRIQLRTARKEFGDEVAVVCGAWHVPALAGKPPTLTADRALLKGLPKVRTELTWVPWTHRRLARHSGYGAGIDSPGWYGHLFDAPDRPVARWMTKVAGLLRDEDRLVSSAHVIEAVRLAEALAAMRGRPLAGLTETTDAIRAVLCDGSDVPLSLVRDRLIVGDVLGEVPDSAPVVPLQRDLTRQQRTLRLKPEAAERELELDLRKDTDAARSRLLHRLRLLGVGWGEPAEFRGSTGTFREGWRLRWDPELSVKVAEAGIWGTTVLAAATAQAESEAVRATALSAVTALAEQCLLAELPDALPVVMNALADRAALDSDVGHLAQALPALARTLRYGDVRGTDTTALDEVAAGLTTRICVGLPPACTGLDDDGAAAMRGHLDAVHTSVGLLTRPPDGALPRAAPAPHAARDPLDAHAGPDPHDSQNAHAAPDPHGPRDPGDAHDPRDASDSRNPHDPHDLTGRWARVLRALADRDTVAGVLRGRSVRLLLDDGRLDEDAAARLMGLALSPGAPPADAAAWIEGFVGGASGSGMLLVHDARLLGLLDSWLTEVPADAFTDVLPLLRRTFSAYEPGVRRTLGELVRRGPAPPGGTPPAPGGPATEAGAPGFGPTLDRARADAVLPLLHLLLGTPPAPENHDPAPENHDPTEVTPR